MKRALAFVMVFILAGMFSACGGNEDISQPPSPPAQSGPAPSGAPPPEPEPEPEPLNQAYLTGLPKNADYPEGKRITAVMLNNVPSARPQNGIGEAKILLEIKVEYNVTRLMAMFEDYAQIPRTGGLRSVRDQFLQLLIPSRGFLVHEGPAEYTHPVNYMLREYEYQDFDITRAYSGFYVDVDRSRTTNSYSWYDISADGIKAAIEARGLDDYRSYASSSFFDFQSYNEPPRVPGDGAVSSVEVGHVPPYYVSYFDYDAAAGRYGMSMHNSASGRREQTVDNNTGQQLFFDNMVVLFAPMPMYPASILPKVDYGIGGVGYYFSQGGWELFIWRKGPANYPLLLYTMDEESMLKINPGTTYLAVLDDALLPDFDASLRSGTMGQGGGGVTGEQQTPED
jgi:hypothetical protein